MIWIMVTGGTFCREYDPRTGEMQYCSEQLENFIGRLNLNIEYHLEVLTMADSRNFKEKDRKNFFWRCKNVASKCDSIVFIHGTDTMVETAEYFAKQEELKSTIVFTGSFWPMSHGFSDAQFNLGYAIACAQQLQDKKQAYIAMSGKCIEALKCRKDWDSLQFKEINPRDVESHLLD